MNPRSSVLLIEDDEDVSVLLSAYIEQHNNKVTCARDGQSAMALFESDGFDVVVLDLMMPRMDGAAFLSWLRDTRNSDIPIIVHTSVVDEAQLQAILSAGGSQSTTHVIRKPAHPDNLIQLINDCTVHHDSQDD